MKKHYILPTITMAVVVDGVEYEIDAKATELDNSGIGAYEYFGAKGFDAGSDYVSDFEIEEVWRTDGVDMTPQEAAMVQAKIDTDEDCAEKILNALDEQLERDYPEREN